MKRKVDRHNRQSKRPGQESNYEARQDADTVMGDVQTEGCKGNGTGHGVQYEPLGQQGAVRACRIGHVDCHVPEGLARVIAECVCAIILGATRTGNEVSKALAVVSMWMTASRGGTNGKHTSDRSGRGV